MQRPSRLLVPAAFLFSLLFLSFAASFGGYAQAPAASHGVVRLKVRYKSDSGTRDLPRKRFFLIKGGFDDNRNLIERIKQTPLVSRQCYYHQRGASSALIKWFDDNDCESAYCREIEEKYLNGSDAVAEFQTAYQQASVELKNPALARRWLTNYLPAEIRSGFYDEKQKVIQSLLSFAEAGTKAGTISVMTDRKGTAYFTNIDPGTYTISNLVASETEKTGIIWICEREVKAVDLGVAMKRPFTLTNEKDSKVKCEVIERALPACGQ